MRSREIVEAFPMGELLLEIDVILIVEELVELLFICAMRTFDLAIELG
jgi:hypothetical protein